MGGWYARRLTSSVTLTRGRGTRRSCTREAGVSDLRCRDNTVLARQTFSRFAPTRARQPETCQCSTIDQTSARLRNLTHITPGISEGHIARYRSMQQPVHTPTTRRYAKSVNENFQRKCVVERMSRNCTFVPFRGISRGFLDPRTHSVC